MNVTYLPELLLHQVKSEGVLDNKKADLPNWTQK